jgi:hypothetical protein
VQYDASTLGVGGKTVTIQLTNTGAGPLAVDHIGAGFSARREGVSFPCGEHGGRTRDEREPASLRPGESFGFERTLDCAMPLPGRYDVQVSLSFGDRKKRPAKDAEAAAAFSIDVVANTNAVPQPYPSRHGLYAIMIGNRATRPLPAEAWARGDYHVVLALINGGTETVRLGPARLGFLVYKKGSPLPCSGQAEPIATPDELRPGAMHVVRAPIACAPSEEGRYEIVGRFTLLAAGVELEVGRDPLSVTRDPMLFTPEPWPAWGDPATGAWVK